MRSNGTMEGESEAWSLAILPPPTSAPQEGLSAACAPHLHPALDKQLWPPLPHEKLGMS